MESGIYVVKNGLLYLAEPDGNRLCIPNVKVGEGRDDTGKNLREMLIEHCHEVLGHMAARKMNGMLRKEYYWKTMVEDVKKYVDSCHSCQTRKTAPTKQYGKNHPLPIPEAPWRIISMDFMVNLPTSAIGGQKFNSLVVFVDLLSKMCHLVPTKTTVNGEGVARIYFEQIYRLHGLPRGLVSDRDPKFTGAFWRTLQKMLGTDLLMSTTYHPQTDGQTERANRSILQILRHFVNVSGSNWAQNLSVVKFAINSAVSRSTGKSPFEIVYGYLPRTFPPIVPDEDNPASVDFVENRMLTQLSAQDAIIAAKTEQSHYVNQHRKDDPEISVGDFVLVSNESQLSHLPKGRRKLALQWTGPYKVTNVQKESSNYTVDIPNSRRHPTFYVSDIKKYVDSDLELFPNRERRQPQIVVEEDPNVEIDKIIAHEKRRNGDIRFLYKWDGFPVEDAIFKKSDDFKDSPAGRKLVFEYILEQGSGDQDLDTWIAHTDWIKDILKEGGPSFEEERGGCRDG